MPLRQVTRTVDLLPTKGSHDEVLRCTYFFDKFTIEGALLLLLLLLLPSFADRSLACAVAEALVKRDPSLRGFFELAFTLIKWYPYKYVY